MDNEDSKARDLLSIPYQFKGQGGRQRDEADI
jgi:hypothetical protein